MNDTVAREMNIINMEGKNRLHTLDYLRGTAALGIMVYHYLSWSLGKFHAEAFLGRVGVYGVSIFYILSGLTLYHVYYDKMQLSRLDLEKFYIKRFFRIYPLLWLCILFTALTTGMPSIQTIFYNVTGLFGVLKWDGYFGIGVWSIGNELAFYLFFPITIFLAKKSSKLLALFSAIVLAIYLYFAFYILSPTQKLDEQWHTYVNPLNQGFLFLSGILIGWISAKTKDISQNIYLIALIISVLAFVFYPVVGDRGMLVVGVNRIIFTLICVMACWALYKMKTKLPKWIAFPLLTLGEISYSLYLMHPVSWAIIFNKYTAKYPVPVSLKVMVAFCLTFLGAYVIYQKYEKYFMNVGKKIIANLS